MDAPGGQFSCPMGIGGCVYLGATFGMTFADFETTWIYGIYVIGNCISGKLSKNQIQLHQAFSQELIFTFTINKLFLSTY